MTFSWQSAIVALAAILVIAIVPVLIQLRRTLRRAEELIRVTGPKLDRALDEAAEAAARVNRIGDRLERDAAGLTVLTDAAAGLGRSIQRVQEAVHGFVTLGTAVVPAVAAGIRSWFGPRREEEQPPPSPRRRMKVVDDRAADDVRDENGRDAAVRRAEDESRGGH